VLAPSLAGWNGLGFVIQAYQKRCPFVIDHVVDLARRSGRRLMVRLVKGAYWDSEIKRAQIDGLTDYPVYTRKVHTDVSYLACARKLLAAPDAIYPQFATHNAQTLASIYQMAKPASYQRGQYEFQCLHGMGEPLYEQVVGPLGRPCRIYAPVGTHETLLAYLVRRLLENGANSSFVHRIADPAVPARTGGSPSPSWTSPPSTKAAWAHTRAFPARPALRPATRQFARPGSEQRHRAARAASRLEQALGASWHAQPLLALPADTAPSAPCPWPCATRRPQRPAGDGARCHAGGSGAGTAGRPCRRRRLGTHAATERARLLQAAPTPMRHSCPADRPAAARGRQDLGQCRGRGARGRGLSALLRRPGPA
jgi:RHH-type proline utilization regulon transcriptional repressor/proline dehydrogenase/delta 1-pyrroline-5-carboxylate dehydrogenase